MDITGHFESASCVIEVDGSATLKEVKQRLLEELGMPRARRVGMRMRGGGDIGDDDVRICDTEMDEGCAVELYCTGNITPGVIPCADAERRLRLSPCEKYLAVLQRTKVSIFSTATHEILSSFPVAEGCWSQSFLSHSEWMSSVDGNQQCIEVRHVKTGALEHSFGDALFAGEEGSADTAWSACGTKLLSRCGKGLQVWDIATGVVVHEWSKFWDCCYLLVVKGDTMVAMVNGDKLAVCDYTTGEVVRELTCAEQQGVDDLAVSPDKSLVAAACYDCVRVLNIETGKCVFKDDSCNAWLGVAVSNDLVAAQSFYAVSMWSISTGVQRFWLRGTACFGVAISSCGDMLVYGDASSGEVNIVEIG